MNRNRVVDKDGEELMKVKKYGLDITDVWNQQILLSSDMALFNMPMNGHFHSLYDDGKDE